MHNGSEESTKTYTFEQIIDRIVKTYPPSTPCGSLQCVLSQPASSMKGKAIIKKWQRLDTIR